MVAAEATPAAVATAVLTAAVTIAGTTAAEATATEAAETELLLESAIGYCFLAANNDDENETEGKQRHTKGEKKHNRQA